MQFLNRLVVEPLGQRRSGGYGRGAASHLKCRFHHSPILNADAELENIAAGWVFHLHDQRGGSENARKTRIFEVIEQTFRVQAHAAMFQWDMEVGCTALIHSQPAAA